MSEDAARAAQHVVDLESDIRELTTDRDNIRAAFEAVKYDNARLEDRTAKVIEERDYYKAKVIAYETRFDDVASLLMKVIDGRPDRVNMEQLEQEITAQESKP